jgi:hypothetical protein
MIGGLTKKDRRLSYPPEAYSSHFGGGIMEKFQSVLLGACMFITIALLPANLCVANETPEQKPPPPETKEKGPEKKPPYKDEKEREANIKAIENRGFDPNSQDFKKMVDAMRAGLDPKGEKGLTWRDTAHLLAAQIRENPGISIADAYKNMQSAQGIKHGSGQANQANAELAGTLRQIGYNKSPAELLKFAEAIHGKTLEQFAGDRSPGLALNDYLAPVRYPSHHLSNDGTTPPSDRIQGLLNAANKFRSDDNMITARTIPPSDEPRRLLTFA